MASPSESDLAVVRAASLEADPFSYSPVIFYDRRRNLAARIRGLVAPDQNPSASESVGRCERGHEYFLQRSWPAYRYRLFVAMLFKGILRVSDVIPIANDPARAVLSKSMFRRDELPGEWEFVSADADRLAALAEEIAMLAIVAGVCDHGIPASVLSPKPDAPVFRFRAGRAVNIEFASDGRFALYDFEPGDSREGRLLRNLWRPTDTLPSAVFGKRDNDYILDFLDRFLRPGESGLEGRLRRLLEHYAGEGGYRLFRAIMIRSRLMGKKPADTLVRAQYDCMMDSAR